MSNTKILIDYLNSHRVTTTMDLQKLKIPHRTFSSYLSKITSSGYTFRYSNKVIVRKTIPYNIISAPLIIDNSQGYYNEKIKHIKAIDQYFFSLALSEQINWIIAHIQQKDYSIKTLSSLTKKNPVVVAMELNRLVRLGYVDPTTKGTYKLLHPLPMGMPISKVPKYISPALTPCPKIDVNDEYLESLIQTAKKYADTMSWLTKEEYSLCVSVLTDAQRCI